MIAEQCPKVAYSVSFFTILTFWIRSSHKLKIEILWSMQGVQCALSIQRKHRNCVDNSYDLEMLMRCFVQQCQNASKTPITSDKIDFGHSNTFLKISIFFHQIYRGYGDCLHLLFMTFYCSKYHHQLGCNLAWPRKRYQLQHHRFKQDRLDRKSGVPSDASHAEKKRKK